MASSTTFDGHHHLPCIFLFHALHLLCFNGILQQTSSTGPLSSHHCPPLLPVTSATSLSEPPRFCLTRLRLPLSATDHPCPSPQYLATPCALEAMSATLLTRCHQWKHHQLINPCLHRPTTRHLSQCIETESQQKLTPSSSSLPTC